LQNLRYQRLSFKLSAKTRDATEWTFRPTGGARSPDCSKTGYVELRQRAAAVLHPDNFAGLRPDLMLSAHCLACGKALTDPVSMSRWVGPECWGSASTNLPRIFKTNGALLSSAPGVAP
jgi:hypothetical protein